MAYNLNLAEKVLSILNANTELDIEEKKMFGGIGYLVNQKMCICISGENLMLRFDPIDQAEIESWPGYIPMIMKNRNLKGYAFISEEGYVKPKDLHRCVKLCLDFNPLAKSSKKKK